MRKEVVSELMNICPGGMPIGGTLLNEQYALAARDHLPTPEEVEKQKAQQEAAQKRYQVEDACRQVFDVADSMMKFQSIEPEIALERAERYCLAKAEYKKNAVENMAGA